MKKESNSIATANEIIGLYRRFGAADYIGEPVSQIEHMCQAAQLAEAEGYDDEVVLAAFFHDIGHFCEHILPAGHYRSWSIIKIRSLPTWKTMPENRKGCF